MMDKSLKNRWVAALRSGEYKQCRNTLHARSQHGEYFCPLGVLRNIEPNIKTSCEVGGVYPGKLDESTSGVPLRVQDRLAFMNDAKHNNFSLIANYIERCL